MPEYYHVVPSKDIKEHWTDDDKCYCNPIVEDNGETIFVIHNSFDYREIFEEVNQILSERE